MSAITELGQRLSSLTFDELDSGVVEAGRQRLFDAVATLIAGATTADAKAMHRLLLASAPKFRTVSDSIRYRCAVIRCTEVDDIHIGSCTTVGSVVVPVALGLASTMQLEDRRVLCSLVAGYEAMTRFGEAVDGTHRVYQGIWPTYIAAPFTAATVSAMLLGLDIGRTSHALAIAATRSTGMTGRISSGLTSRWFSLGCAAADGFLAAHAAAAGLDGDIGVLEGSFGPACGVTFDPEFLTADRDGWKILDVDTKPFCSSRQGLAAIDAYLRLPVRSTAEVDAVVIAVPEQYRRMLDHPQPPRDRLGSILSIQYQLALAAYDQARLSDVRRDTLNEDSSLRSFMERVRVQTDDRLTALYPNQWGARLTVSWRDGTHSSMEVLDPRGCAKDPLDWSALVQKHRAIALSSDGGAISHSLALLDTTADLCQQFGKERGRISSGKLLASLPGL